MARKKTNDKWMPPVGPYGRYEPVERMTKNLEHEMHHRFRWADETPYHPQEPPTITRLRQILDTDPAKFYSLYQVEKNRWDEFINRYEDDQEESKDADGSAECIALVDSLIKKHLEKTNV